jgi:hypothetical protein
MGASAYQPLPKLAAPTQTLTLTLTLTLTPTLLSSADQQLAPLAALDPRSVTGTRGGALWWVRRRLRRLEG